MKEGKRGGENGQTIKRTGKKNGQKKSKNISLKYIMKRWAKKPMT